MKKTQACGPGHLLQHQPAAVALLDKRNGRPQPLIIPGCLHQTFGALQLAQLLPDQPEYMGFDRRPVAQCAAFIFTAQLQQGPAANLPFRLPGAGEHRINLGAEQKMV
ncbi:hypothetical protein D3C76_1468770 [compost metagenome]